MRIHARQVFYVVFAVVLVILAVVAMRPEPSYEGKTVREWVWQYAKTNRQGFHEPPTVAMKQMGQRAVPLLITELQRQNPATHKLRFRMWNASSNWMRTWVHRRMRDPYDVPDAYMIRESAAITLGSLGGEARSAIPNLRVALGDSTPHVRLKAAYAMWQIDHTLASEVVPILVGLHTNSYNFKYYTSLYFGSIGLDAKAAVPLLRETLTDDNPNTRENAKTALQKLELAERKEQNANH